MNTSTDPSADTGSSTAARWFDWPRGALTSLVLILLVCLPGLGTNFVADDLLHREMLRGSQAGALRTADMAYCFGGGPKHVAPLKWEPWWTNPELRLCYFRPLSSLTLALDHRLFANHPAAAHVHGLLWFLLACGGVYFLARTLLDDRTAAVASFIYGTSTAAFTARLWIAARHASVAAAFCAVGLALYVAHRQRGHTLRAAFGLAVLALGLLGGEGALGGFGFVFAYELVCAKDSRRTRLAFGSVAAALVLGFVGWYSHTGFGAVGCGAYLDPMRNPVEFLAALPGRSLTLLSQVVFGTPSGPWMMPPLRPVLPLSGALGLGLLLAAVGLRREQLGTQVLAVLRFLAFGAALAVGPATTALLGGRVLLIPGIGLSIFLAAVTRPWERSTYALPVPPLRLRPLLGRLAVLALIAGFAVLSPVIDVGQLYFLYLTERAERQMASSPLDRCPAAERYFVLGTNEITVGWYAPYLLKDAIGQRPWDQLSLATGDLELTRTGERAICLHTRGGQVLAGMLYQEFGPQDPTRRGHRDVALTGATLHLGEANARGVQSLCLELTGPHAAPADDPRYCWLRYDGTRLLPIRLPAIGDGLTIPYVKGPLTDF